MTASNFNTALAFTLQSEGGWSDNPADPGGATMKGITIATYRVHHPNATPDQLRNISDSEVADIYRSGYWNAVKGDDLPGGIDLSVFDFGVNAGPGRSVKIMQTALGVTADGIVGPITMGAIAKADQTSLIRSLAEHQLSYYLELDGWPTFGKGWTTRTIARRTAALQLVGVTMSASTTPAVAIQPGGTPAAPITTTTTGGQVPQTAAQPSHSLANVIDHPGSSWAGLGVAAVAIGNAVQAGSMPTTSAGWVSFIASLAVAVAAALGK